MTPSVKVMLGFGGNVLGFSMVDFLAKNMDRIGIGSRSGARLLGYYQSALLVYDNTLDLTFPLHNVAVASLSKLQSDVTSLRTLWAKALSTLAFYGMPAFGILSVTGQDTIVLLLGEKWSSASLLLSVLALRGPAHLASCAAGQALDPAELVGQRASPADGPPGRVPPTDTVSGSWICGQSFHSRSRA